MSFKEALLRTNSKPIQSDIKKLTPQSMYHGTEEYFREKLGDRLPDEQYQFMELQTQLHKQNKEINENHINYLESIKEQAIYEFNRLMDEYKEKEEEGKDDLHEEPIKEGVTYLKCF
jgi:hypothetical protein